MEDLDGKHLEAGVLDGTRAMPSSTGGIPIIERVDIEDLEDGYSSGDLASPKSVADMCNTSATVHAILRTSKHEREALYSTRKKLHEALAFLKDKGFSEEQVLARLQHEGFGKKPPSRDDFGLPIPPVGESVKKPNSPDPFKYKMKNQVQVEVPVVQEDPEDEVFEVLPKQDSPIDTGPPSAGNKSWANVLKTEKENYAKFSYFPLGKDEKIVEPPLEVLKQGNEKYKFCVVGTFTKRVKSFKEVSEFAHKMWGNRGLLKVFQ